MSAPPEETESVPEDKTDRKVRKARMLVSMLGADFAKSSKHPFFRDLAQTAIKPISDDRLSKPEMSRALEKLVRHLADPKSPRRIKPRAEVVEPENVEIAEPVRMANEDVLKQHPVLIAKHLLTLSPQARIDVLRALPGRTARMVASYSAELKNDP